MDISCPVPGCRASNSALADRCLACGAVLGAYGRLQARSASLFNEGIALAREGRLSAARDRFAAVVFWFPMDPAARNALALACYQLRDAEGARLHWRNVAVGSKGYELALRGLAALDEDQAGIEDAAKAKRGSTAGKAAARKPAHRHRKSP